ncbi:MAG: hypothetical protein KDD43_13885, partial [Bdellovibrionales bacterium]|nr:hypothetical protein [Bdellovibrionales bacterium]
MSSSPIIKTEIHFWKSSRRGTFSFVRYMGPAEWQWYIWTENGMWNHWLTFTNATLLSERINMF